MYIYIENNLLFIPKMTGKVIMNIKIYFCRNSFHHFWRGINWSTETLTLYLFTHMVRKDTNLKIIVSTSSPESRSFPPKWTISKEMWWLEIASRNFLQWFGELTLPQIRHNNRQEGSYLMLSLKVQVSLYIHGNEPRANCREQGPS